MTIIEIAQGGRMVWPNHLLPQGIDIHMEHNLAAFTALEAGELRFIGTGVCVVRYDALYLGSV